MTEYTIFHLDVDGTVTKTLGTFGDGMTLNAHSLHPSYRDDSVYYHSFENPWLSSGVIKDVDDFDGNYEEGREFTSSEDEFTIHENPDPLKGYFLVLHSYNDRVIRTRNLPYLKNKVLNGVLRDLFPQSVYYGNAAIVKTDLRDDSVEHIEEEWSVIRERIQRGNWMLDIDGHIVHSREYKILGRKVRISDILKRCPPNSEIEDDLRDPRDIYDYISRTLSLRGVKSPHYDIYGNIDDMYLGKRVSTLSKSWFKANPEEKELRDWLRKLTGNGDYEILTIYSCLN